MTVEYIHEWLTVHGEWLGVAIALMAMLEAVAIVGFFIPGIPIMLVLGTLAGSGIMDAEVMLMWAFLGAVVGDGISYQIGARFHGKIREWWPFSKYPTLMEKGESFFFHYGDASVALGRFIGPLRPIVPVVAGMLDMPAIRFYIVNIISAIPWAVVYMMPGYIAAQSILVEKGNSLPLLGFLFIVWLAAVGGVFFLFWCDRNVKINKLFVPVLGSSLAMVALFFLGISTWFGWDEHWHRIVVSWMVDAHFPDWRKIWILLDIVELRVWFFGVLILCFSLSFWKSSKKKTALWVLFLSGLVGFQYLVTFIFSSMDSTVAYYILKVAGSQLVEYGVLVVVILYTSMCLSGNMPFLKRVLFISLVFLSVVVMGGVVVWQGMASLVFVLGELVLAMGWFGMAVFLERLYDSGIETDSREV